MGNAGLIERTVALLSDPARAENRPRGPRGAETARKRTGAGRKRAVDATEGGAGFTGALLGVSKMNRGFVKPGGARAGYLGFPTGFVSEANCSGPAVHRLWAILTTFSPGGLRNRYLKAHA